jgi:hypothetical protein
VILNDERIRESGPWGPKKLLHRDPNSLSAALIVPAVNSPHHGSYYGLLTCMSGCTDNTSSRCVSKMRKAHNVDVLCCMQVSLYDYFKRFIDQFLPRNKMCLKSNMSLFVRGYCGIHLIYYNCNYVTAKLYKRTSYLLPAIWKSTVQNKNGNK